MIALIPFLFHSDTAPPQSQVTLPLEPVAIEHILKDWPRPPSMPVLEDVAIPESVLDVGSLEKKIFRQPAYVTPEALEYYATRASNASTDPQTVQRGMKEVVVGNGTGVALTIDAHYCDPGMLHHYLDIADDYRAEGISIHYTFFITGHFMRQALASGQMLSVFERIADGGHELANHTDTHPHPQELPEAHFDREILEAERLVAKLNDQMPLHLKWAMLLRNAYGERNPAFMRRAAELGYQMIYWTTDSFDWTIEGDPTIRYRPPEESIERVLSRHRPGGIYLFHGSSQRGSTKTTAWFRDVIDGLIKKGVAEFYTVSDMIDLGRN
ncbi:MAG: polysaccharide deacetylase family protein [archaeon]